MTPTVDTHHSTGSKGVYVPNRDATLPVGERVLDLLSRMTLEEKAAQTAASFGATVDTHTPPTTGWRRAVTALSSLGATPREAAAAANSLRNEMGDVDDDQLASALRLTLARTVMHSQGALPDDLPVRLLEQVKADGRGSAASMLREHRPYDHPLN